MTERAENPLAAALARWADEVPTAPAAAWGGGAWTYGELRAEARARAADFAEAGVGAGSVVALVVRAGEGFLQDLLALWWLGAVPAPVHRGLPWPERQWVLGLFRPELLVDDEGRFSSTEWEVGALRFDPAEGVAALIATSGSSGRPKGVVLGHAALETSARASARRLGLGSRDRWALALSPAHAGGLTTIVRAVHLGASLRLWRPPGDPGRMCRPADLAQGIRGGDVTHVSLVPALLAALLDDGLSNPPLSCECLLVGGARTPGSLFMRAMDADLPVALTWGLSETGGQVATAPPEVAAMAPDTVGRVLDGMEVRVGPGRRMQVRGPFLAPGWIPEAGADPRPLPLERGDWFTTEDMGRIDDFGLIRIEGRADEVIVSGGTNVSPHEVETVLLRAPGVAEAGVWGVDDERWGQVVVAAVVAVEGEPLEVARVQEHCRAHLMRSKCPSDIVVVPALPKTPSGKLARRRLPELTNPTDPS